MEKLIMQELAGPDKRDLLAGKRASALKRAIRWLGRRYVLHKANRVKRLTTPRGKPTCSN